MMLQFFDSNVFVGKSGTKHRRRMWKTEDIVMEMERTGIAGALVYHGMAKSHSPRYGNALLREELMKSDRLFGCWVVLPEHLGDFMTPDELVHEMKQNCIYAVKMFPKSHVFDVDERTLGALLSRLQTERLPLLVDGGEIEFSQLAWILEAFPNLPVILQGLGWSRERYLFPILDEFHNLYIDLSALQSNEFVEVVYERYGSKRIIFGSGAPNKSPGAARSFIDYAWISTEDKQKMAGGNLARLLGVTPKPVTIPLDADSIVKEAAEGLPLSIPVYDSHTHLIEEGGETGSGFPMLRGTIDPMVKRFQSLGIEKMSIAAWVGINGGDSEAGNEVTYAAMQKYPDIVEGYALFDPNYVENIAEQAKKHHVELGFKGVKPYYFLSRTDYTDVVYEPWWQIANELQLYALVDPALLSDQAYTAQIDELAARYPNVSFFMDHAARSWEIAELYASIAKKHANVYLQLTYTTVTLGAIEYLVDEVGAEKVLFGTDSPMRDPRPQVGWLAYANISFEQKKAIFGENMLRIWNRCLNQ